MQNHPFAEQWFFLPMAGSPLNNPPFNKLTFYSMGMKQGELTTCRTILLQSNGFSCPWPVHPLTTLILINSHYYSNTLWAPVRHMFDAKKARISQNVVIK